MPELPDVETMRRYLEATSLHQRIEDVEVHAASLILSEGVPEQTAVRELREGVEGRSFASARRHGKYVFVALDEESGESLVLHFGMTGGLKYLADMDEEPKYARVLFHFANGYHLAYQSVRKLGEVKVIGEVEQFVDERGLGPDVLDSGFDFTAFKEAIKGRRAMVKAVLMEQGTVAGIGNVYSDEILFHAGIHPRTKIDRLEEETVEELFHAMRDVLQTAIGHQAEPEQMPESFMTPHRHEGGRCPQCGAELERVKVSSRSAYYCPNRQHKTR
jgi:formamidopyrimidine-DNA glycosylase